MVKEKITIGNVCFLIDKAKNEILFWECSFEPMKNMFTGVGGKTNFDEDIHSSCIREVKEETGLIANKIKLVGIIKTILNKKNSIWILFIYRSDEFSGTQIE